MDSCSTLSNRSRPWSEAVLNPRNKLMDSSSAQSNRFWVRKVCAVTDLAWEQYAEVGVGTGAVQYCKPRSKEAEIPGRLITDRFMSGGRRLSSAHLSRGLVSFFTDPGGHDWFRCLAAPVLAGTLKGESSCERGRTYGNFGCWSCQRSRGQKPLGESKGGPVW